MNPSTMDSTGSNPRPQPVPFDGSPGTERPSRLAFLLTSALALAVMLAAGPGPASAQTPLVLDNCLVKTGDKATSIVYTNNCNETISVTGALQTSGSCDELSGAEISATPGSNTVTYASDQLPGRVCFEYKSAMSQYRSGFRNCASITSPDLSGCGQGDDLVVAKPAEIPDGTIHSSPGNSRIAEGSNSHVQAVWLTAAVPPVSNIVLNITSDNQDVTVNHSSRTFTGIRVGNTSTNIDSITVTAEQDTDGTDDTAIITYTPTAASGLLLDNKTVRITVTDDDGSIDVSTPAVNLTEGGTTGTFTVTLGAPPASNATISVASGDTDAVTVLPATLTFTDDNYDTAQMITVTPVEDSDGTNESVTITLAVTGTGYTASNATKTITVTDDDGEIEISSGAVTVVESGSTGTFTVKLGTPPSSTAVLSVAGDSKATVSPSTLTFTAANYATAQEVTVTAAQDTDGTDSTATITVSTSSGYTASDETKTVSVTDDDGAIEISSGAVTAIEDGTAGTFTVTLAAPPASSATLSVTSMDTNIATISPATLTFTTSNYDTAQTVTVTGIHDNDGTDDSTTITLAVSGSGYTASDATKTITVTDDDGEIEVSTPAVTINESGGGTGTFTVKLGTPPSSTAVLSLAGDSKATVSPATLTFTAANYDTAQTVTVTAAQDNDGTDSTATITVSTSSGYEASDATKTVSITDDDGEIEISSGAVTAIENGTDGTFTVTLAAPPASSATLSVTSMDTTIATISPATLTFTSTNYDMAQTVTVTGTGDDDGTDDSTTITLAVSGSGYTASDATKTIAVSDDDGSIDISSAAVNLTEGGSAGTFNVKLGAAPASSVTLSVASGDTGAVTVLPPTLTFTDSNYSTDQMVTVTPVDDNDGTTESVDITFAVSDSDDYTASDATKAITVTDDDGEIEVSSPAVTINESGGGTGTFTVTLAAPPSSSAVLSVAGDSKATVSPATLTFTAANYDTAQTVTVTAAQDIDGTDSIATITISSPGDYEATNATKAITVIDDDGVIEISSPAVTAIESGTDGTFTVTLAAPPASSATLSVASTPEATVSPATLTFTSSNYNTAQTVTVTAAQDIDGTDDSATATLSVTGGYTASDATKAISVIDDDGVILLESKAVALTEGGSADSFTVTLAAPPTQSATLSVVSGDTLSVTVSPATLTFTASNYATPQTVTVYPADDNDDRDESADITFAVTAGYTASDATKTITVNDDDGAIELGNEVVDITEGGDTGTFTVTLTEPPISSATLLVISGDTGVATVSPSTLTFSPSNYATPQTVTVRAVHDEDGSDDSATITLAATAGYLALNVTKTITVRDDDGSIEISDDEVELIEGGITGAFTVTLAAPPTSSATFSVVSGDIGAVTVSPGTLTFTSSNYATPQRVILTPLYDTDRSDESVAITVAATAGYRASDATKDVAVKDDDGKIVVSGTNISIIEGGSVGSLTVKLVSAPASNATVEVESGDTGAVTVSPATLTFTPSNYATAQMVILTAVEDADGTDESVAVQLTSSDAYPASGLSATVEVIDDDGRIDISAGAVDIVEDGDSGTFTVKLAAPPASSAVLSVSSAKPAALTASPQTLTFTPLNYATAQTITVTPVEDADADDESVAITVAVTEGYTASDAMKTIAVEDDEVAGNIVLDAPSTLNIDEGGTGVIEVSIDTAPKRDVTIVFSNTNEDIRFSPTSLSFDSSNYNQARSVLVIADPDHDDANETDTITVSAESGLVAASVTRAVSITDGLSGGSIITSPERRLLVDEGGSVTLLVTLGSRPDADTTVSLSNPGEGLMLSPSSLDFEPAHWNRPQTVIVGAVEDEDVSGENEVIVLSAEDFSGTSVIVEVKDTTEPLPMRARSLALPPSSVADDAILRVRCKQQTPCLVFLDCNAQEDGSHFEGWIRGPIPAYGTRTLTVQDIEDYTGGGSWSGKGRLGCALRSAERISAQVWTRSGDGVLVNNSAAIDSAPEYRWYRADIESIPSPDGPEESNLRIRCLAPEGFDCTRAGFSCFDDDGRRFDVGLGAIERLTVYHMQSEELATRIGHRWTGLGLTCEFRSDHPFTVQVMTRTGGGGALVNNSATGEMPR